MKITVEVWFDFACPFCYMGHRHLEMALEKFEHKDNVEISYRSFELSPDESPDKSKSIYEHLSQMKGISMERSKMMHEDIANRGTLVGLHYQFDQLIPTNTKKAHRLLHFASSMGKGNEMIAALFAAYFTNGIDLEDNVSLITLGKNLGLSEEEVKTVVETDVFLKQVDEDAYDAWQEGISSVPYFVIHNKYAIQGAQPVQSFVSVLNHVWEELHKAEV